MTETLVMYGMHPKLLPGAICEGCGIDACVTDHCHAHGWVRGQICTRCNHLMSIIDRRITPKVERSLIDTLLTLWHRCPECSQGDPIELRSGECEPTIPNCSIAVRAGEARTRLRDILTVAEFGGFSEIQRYDTPTAIVVSPDWFKRALTSLGEPEPRFEPEGGQS